MDNNNCFSLINNSRQTSINLLYQVEQNVTLIKNIEIQEQKNKELYLKSLERIFSLLQKNQCSCPKLQLEKPLVTIEGYRSIWQNYSKICEQIKINSQVVDYYFSASFCHYVLIRNQQLIIRGQRVKTTHILQLLQQFLKQLICYQCKRADTNLVKDRKTKLIFKECNVCKATCTVEGSKFKYFRFP
ncbi:unnamed protein product (macronuclear) [Paramecium tetraurelia]|uniref:Translation initiation factor IF2/IF5 domain-containing protein n=1 Tax=Paramecium tetraurelia TaxID=5888 RepID=A0BJL4_PARTE|nr:uncharacterized protein GSPATT00029359001 [Paramecium tetraurelia]CAK58731.1 unnamed protein product [Paramecium tetraurelia]|eukprot:XP_001426129.1 hypothetical protein (macronuclear) [Paramecium tetraurelia strain d4-2]